MKKKEETPIKVDVKKGKLALSKKAIMVLTKSRMVNINGGNKILLGGYFSINVEIEY